MNKPLHISFDLDGTLIDSIPLMKMSWENVVKKLNINIGWSSYKKNIGLPFKKICENLNIEKIENEVKDLYFDFNQKNIHLIKPMRGLKECMTWIKENEIEWSIITSKPSITTFDVCKYFSLDPQYLITSDMLPIGKPSKEPSDYLRNLLGKKERNFYYVGDTVIDHIFAINSSFSYIEFIDSSTESELNFSEKKLIRNQRPMINDLSLLKSVISLPQVDSPK
jgi:phosphoglycolate phosphatase-like HAD superfamily hydrolase